MVTGRGRYEGDLVTLTVTVRCKSLSDSREPQFSDRTSASGERAEKHANGMRDRHLHGFQVATGR